MSLEVFLSALWHQLLTVIASVAEFLVKTSMPEMTVGGASFARDRYAIKMQNCTGQSLNVLIRYCQIISTDLHHQG